VTDFGGAGAPGGGAGLSSGTAGGTLGVSGGTCTPGGGTGGGEPGRSAGATSKTVTRPDISCPAPGLCMWLKTWQWNTQGPGARAGAMMSNVWAVEMSNSDDRETSPF
jgi:hypothetical protein